LHPGHHLERRAESINQMLMNLEYLTHKADLGFVYALYCELTLVSATQIRAIACVNKNNFILLNKERDLNLDSSLHCCWLGTT